jgi:hypothetical protein
MACPRAKGEHTANIARMRTIRFNGWPPLAGYEIVCHFSVVEVVLERPALFEDILIHLDVWVLLTNLYSGITLETTTVLKREHFL